MSGVHRIDPEAATEQLSRLAEQYFAANKLDFSEWQAEAQIVRTDNSEAYNLVCKHPTRASLLFRYYNLDNCAAFEVPNPIEAPNPTQTTAVLVPEQ